MDHNIQVKHHPVDRNPPLYLSLLGLLSNTLILYQAVPYLPVSSLLALSATSQAFKSIIYDTPSVFRYLDLTRVKPAQFEIAAIDHGGEIWRNVQVDENVTEDDFYGGPLLGIFSTLRRRDILRDVQTLILDGLSVTSDLISGILTQEHYNVRLLSIREVQNMNERKLQQALIYAVRPSRAPSTPKLKGLYVFGPKDAPLSPLILQQTREYPSGVTPTGALPSVNVVHLLGAQIGAAWSKESYSTVIGDMAGSADKWYQTKGNVIKSRGWPSTSTAKDWADTLLACQGVISFDAVLCSGPRHWPSVSDNDRRSGVWYRSRDAHLPSHIATHSVGNCHGCGKAPEGFAKYGTSPIIRFPLLAPLPLHSSTVEAAKGPFTGSIDEILARCSECVKSRFCESCHKFWCEDCLESSTQGHPGAKLLGAENATVGEKTVKVHMGLCVADCLVTETMSGAGSNGMWG